MYSVVVHYECEYGGIGEFGTTDCADMADAIGLFSRIVDSVCDGPGRIVSVMQLGPGGAVDDFWAYCEDEAQFEAGAARINFDDWDNHCE